MAATAKWAWFALMKRKTSRARSPARPVPFVFTRQREGGLPVLLDDLAEGGLLGTATAVQDGSTSL